MPEKKEIIDVSYPEDLIGLICNSQSQKELMLKEIERIEVLNMGNEKTLKQFKTNVEILTKVIVGNKSTIKYLDFLIAQYDKVNDPTTERQFSPLA